MFYTQDSALAQSPVVANRDMNRERGLVGPNSYAKALKFDIQTYLQNHNSLCCRWLDVCCGSGVALWQAHQAFPQIHLVGVDLVPFQRPELATTPIQLQIGAIETFTDSEPFDLITCVHGLHYLGDKLGILSSLLGALKPEGMAIANINLMDIQDGAGKSLGRRLLAQLRSQGVQIDQRNRILTCVGPRDLAFPVQYLGSDDAMGPNYTGQPAVRSFYTWL
jgi:SAM-dependent methyltransferase